jgi:hypothetical protein
MNEVYHELTYRYQIINKGVNGDTIEVLKVKEKKRIFT